MPYVFVYVQVCTWVDQQQDPGTLEEVVPETETVGGAIVLTGNIRRIRTGSQPYYPRKAVYNTEQ